MSQIKMTPKLSGVLGTAGLEAALIELRDAEAVVADNPGVYNPRTKEARQADARCSIAHHNRTIAVEAVCEILRKNKKTKKADDMADQAMENHLDGVRKGMWDK